MTAITTVDARSASQIQRHQVLGLLREVDHEFFPPLSSRTGTLSLEAVPVPVDPASGLAMYLHAMLDESWLLARRDEQVVGVLSYLVDHVEPTLERQSPSLYVTTIAVARGWRGSGVGTALYDALFVQAGLAGAPWITTRTWSTNEQHIRLLVTRGFDEVARRPRLGFVDSVYLARRVSGRRPD
jgi:ribosomal protein S18 acetylase RimI-like enzyme